MLKKNSNFLSTGSYYSLEEQVKPEERHKGILDLYPDAQRSRAYVVDLYHHRVIPKNGWKDAHQLYNELVTYYKEKQKNIDRSFYYAVAQITSAIAFHHNAFVALDDPNGEAFKRPRFITHHDDIIFDYYVLDHHEMQHYQLFISNEHIQFDLLSSQPWPQKP